MKNSIIKAVKGALCREVIAFDLETTGLDAKTNRIIEFGGIKLQIDNNGKITSGEELHLYINPDDSLSEKITEITGITPEFLADKPSEKDVFDQIYSFVGDKPILLGHNVKFDIRFLENTYQRYGKSLKPSGILDTLDMSRDCLGTLVENHKLATVAGYYGIDAKFHSAIEDIRATVIVAEQFIPEYAEANVTEKLKPYILGVKYWCQFKIQRLYVLTAIGSIYMDAKGKCWDSKDINIDSVDLDYVESYLKKTSGCYDLHQVVQHYYRLSQPV